jgi:hypothetical protein
MTRHTTRGGELPDEAGVATEVLPHLRVGLRVRPLEVDVPEQRRSTVTGAGDVDAVASGPPDHAVGTM